MCVARQGGGRFAAEVGLYSPKRERKYVNREERSRFLRTAEQFDADRCLFVLVLAWTGARVSEILALTPASFQVETGVVVITTLKRRKLGVREVPIPPKLMARLDRCFGLRRLQRGAHSAQQLLWPWHRATAWRLVKHVMTVAGVFRTKSCPRGLRHGFGVGALQTGVPLHLIQRWMGHARLSTTAIYMNVSGPEERHFARRFWHSCTSYAAATASRKR
jgi:integrase